MDIKQFLNKTLLVTKTGGQVLLPWGTYMVEYVKAGKQWVEVTAPDDAQYFLSPRGKWTDENGIKIDVELL